MHQYVVKLFGQAMTKPLEWEDRYTSTKFAVDHVERMLPHYWPIYYSAAIWKIDEVGGHELVAEMKSSVKVERVVQ